MHNQSNTYITHTYSYNIYIPSKHKVMHIIQSIIYTYHIHNQSNTYITHTYSYNIYIKIIYIYIYIPSKHTVMHIIQQSYIHITYIIG